MSTLPVWAIRHKPTGKFMPARMFRTARAGWTYWDPLDKSPETRPYDPSPRLFFTRQAAANALSAWLQGKWKQEVQTEGSWDEAPYDYLAEPTPTAVATRSREDMELVEGTLSL